VTRTRRRRRELDARGWRERRGERNNGGDCGEQRNQRRTDARETPHATLSPGRATSFARLFTASFAKIDSELVLDRADAFMQAGRDLFVAEAFAHQQGNLALAGRELREHGELAVLRGAGGRVERRDG